MKLEYFHFFNLLYLAFVLSFVLQQGHLNESILKNPLQVLHLLNPKTYLFEKGAFGTNVSHRPLHLYDILKKIKKGFKIS